MPPFEPIYPFQCAEIINSFAPLLNEQGLVIAVSGGADSMALLALVAWWRERILLPVRDEGQAFQAGGDVSAGNNGGTNAGAVKIGPARIIVATIDHGLRPEAADEAALVAELAVHFSLPHYVLHWQPSQFPQTGLQAKARTARYELLARLCYEQGCSAIVTAHHRQDQAETVLMRLARGSGVTGLAAMLPVSDLPATLSTTIPAASRCEPARPLRLHRPLLSFAPNALRTLLRHRQIRWAEDPSNRNMNYERARWRTQLSHGARAGMADARVDPPVDAADSNQRANPIAGLSGAALARSAARLQRADAALAAITADQLRTNLQLHEGGYVTMPLKLLRAVPDEIALRLINACLMIVRGQMPGPRLSRLERFWQGWRAGRKQQTGRYTLFGCVLDISHDQLWVYREGGQRGPGVLEICLDRIANTVINHNPDKNLLYDGRIVIAASEPANLSGAARRGPVSVSSSMPCEIASLRLMPVQTLLVHYPDARPVIKLAVKAQGGQSMAIPARVVDALVCLVDDKGRFYVPALRLRGEGRPVQQPDQGKDDLFDRINLQWSGAQIYARLCQGAAGISGA